MYILLNWNFVIRSYYSLSYQFQHCNVPLVVSHDVSSTIKYLNFCHKLPYSYKQIQSNIKGESVCLTICWECVRLSSCGEGKFRRRSWHWTKINHTSFLELTISWHETTCTRHTHTHTWWCSGWASDSWLDSAAAAGSTPGRGTVKSTKSTQPSIPTGLVNRVPACMAWVKAWYVHLCWVAGNTVSDAIWQVTLRSYHGILTSINGYTVPLPSLYYWTHSQPCDVPTMQYSARQQCTNIYQLQTNHHHHHREVLTDRCAPPWPLAT